MTLLCSGGFQVYVGDSSRLLCMIAEREGATVAIRELILNESRTLVVLPTILLNSRVGNASVLPETVVHA